MKGHERDVETILAAPVYEGYQYAYPHKTAYRRLPRPAPLDELWADERKDALSLYVHVPFCEMRCGFCNLFTLNRAEALVTPYMAALEIQAEAVAASLGRSRIARMAIGGGTPTFLAAAELDRIFEILQGRFGARPTSAPCSVETSPATATPERLAVLAAHGVDRISIGVESFLDSEAKAMGRPQARPVVEAALGAIRAAGFRTLNIDLIYGAAGQTPASFLVSVDAALAWRPEELYLYPLYIRPLTGLGRRAGASEDAAWDAQRLAIYRAAREHLLAAGYTQVSMRMFRRACLTDWGPAYDCASDGLVGLGPGARSYTAALHYSSEYSVGQAGIAAIVADFCARDAARHGAADHGAWLDDEDRRRRFLLMGLLQAEGISLAAYAEAFGAPLPVHFPQLDALAGAGLAAVDGDRLALTAAGLERSDAIGPWLQGTGVRERMRSYAPR